MNRRYNIDNFIRALKKPSLFVEEFERVISKKMFEAKNGKGIDVMNKDWDNLLILDACRYDIFPEHSEIEGEYRTVVSRGNDSRSFIDKNFSNRELHDTIYVTANPFVENISDDVFFRVVYKDLFEHWDESLNTIPPDAVAEQVLRVHKEHPNKRIIAHFMQPHAPYIGEKGRSSERRFGKFNPDIDQKGEFEVPEANIPEAIENNLISESELEELYRENLDVVLDEAEKLVNCLDGKSVLTSDHGELLGDRVFGRKRYGHSRYHTTELRRVPWFTVNFDDRRDITKGEPQSFDALSNRDQRLQALGYIE